MILPCGCEIDPQYLPLNGGERMYRCEHAEYIIGGLRVTKTEFVIVSTKELKDNGKRVTE